MTTTEQSAGNRDNQTHRYLVSVDLVKEIDPDRLEEWVKANFDTDDESVVISDLTEGDSVSAPVVFDDGPEPEDLHWEAMEDE